MRAVQTPPFPVRRTALHPTPAERRIVTTLVPRLLAWFAMHARDLPWRRTGEPYAIWVSEIMLQQTQVKTVIPYWKRWLRELPDVAALAQAEESRLHKLWEGLGYYTRVRNLQRAARRVMAEYGGKFPGRFEDVLALPGIGRYTAGAICSIAFNQPTPIVDGNVARVLTRVFGIGGDVRAKATRARLWALAETLVSRAARLETQDEGRGTAPGLGRTCLAASGGDMPGISPQGSNPGRGAGNTGQECPVNRQAGKSALQSACSHLNQSLMELGALVCTPRSPSCVQCPVRTSCVAAQRGDPERFPVKQRRPTVTARRFVAFVVERAGKVLVRQRPAGGVNAGLWEFPNLELPADVARSLAGEPLCTIKHSITRYRITLEARRVRPSQLPAELRNCGGRWCGSQELEQLAFTSAHRRIVRALPSPTRHRTA